MQHKGIFFKSLVADLVTGAYAVAAPSIWLNLYQLGWRGYLWIGLAGCYPIGKVLQSRMIGPRITRWYLADLGFVHCWALWVTTLMYKNNPFKFKYDALLGATLAAVGAVILEAGEMIAKTGGEWKDILIFLSTFLLFVLLL